MTTSKGLTASSRARKATRAAATRAAGGQALDQIRIRGARQNNLAGVDLDLPRGALVAITGVSGSGKSSLAFDTLFREGQRRFLETLSAYARQFLGDMQKPDIESIEGLSPAIAVDQKTIVRGNRSTVGTLTEIVDHLRVLFARAGQAHCPGCGTAIQSRTAESVVQEILRDLAGQRVQLLAPKIRDRKGFHTALFEELRRKGFVRVRVDGELHRLEEVPELARYKRHTIEVVIDRLKPDPADPGRLRESVAEALVHGEGDLIVLSPEGETRLSTQRSCPDCGTETPPLEPRLFSFNSPHGACPSCEGLGSLRRPTEAAVVRDASLTLREGALAVTRASGGALLFPKVSFDFLASVGAAHDFDLDTPFRELSAAGKRALLYGTGEERFDDTASWNGARHSGQVDWRRKYRGVMPALARAWARNSRRKQIERYLSVAECETCGGSRLNAASRAVRFGGLSLASLTTCPVDQLVDKLDGLKLGKREARIARDLLAEVRRRTEFLLRVGLGYLCLDRSADSLSGGEAQRIRLAAQLGSALQGVLYVLDEPSIGLHASDHARLLGALAALRDAGNSVIVVEHDEATLRAADWIVDVGPGAGAEGGHVVAQGPPSQVFDADTPTGRLLRGEIHIPKPDQRRAGNGKSLRVRGARAFNLKDVDVAIPLGTLTVVTGVSGSGKSTLIDRTLKRAVLRHLGRETADPGAHDAILGLESVDELVAIDASPIGRTTRSNPATYTKVLGPIRDLFASLPEALVRGYDKSRFSFNIAGGRCEECQGGGARYVELQFLAPVTVPCEECGGHRFQAETLDVRYRQHSIADVLALPAREALELFQDHPRIRRPLELMVEIGLGYLTLGQPSTTLSGGEAQRLKLVTHLSKRPKEHTLYLLDEPTTGLHMEDVGRLVAALQRLVDMGHSVVVIEHNLELASAADHLIDLGPGGGEGGGRLVVCGSPEQVMACAQSLTGAAMRSLDEKRTRSASPLPRPRAGDGTGPANTLRIEGASTHNLAQIDVEIPRDALTVITGPSGSGKSSLALDTIYTEGRRRFVESLSTYARQFLGTKDRPPVEKIEGLGPSVAVEARTVGSHPRSTVATTTEIHDHLRVLWARAGTAHCPEHGETLARGDASSVTRRLLADFAAPEGKAARGWILSPVFGHGRERPFELAGEKAEKGMKSRILAWRAAGFARLVVDGQELRFEEVAPKWSAVGAVDLVIDRLGFEKSARARIAEAVEQAAALSHGRVSVLAKAGAGQDPRRMEYSLGGACSQCGFQLSSELEPRHFSFNTHVGACPDCDGLGAMVQCAAELLVTRPERELTNGAIEGKLGTYLTKGKGYYEMLLRTVAEAHKIDIERPFARLTEKQRALLMHGEGARKIYTVALDRHTENTDIHQEFTSEWVGLCGTVDAWHRKTLDPDWARLLEKVMTRRTCKLCLGERLAPQFRFVTVGRKRLPELLSATVGEILPWLAGLRLRKAQSEAVAPVVQELRSRLELLERVGLDYLTLERPTQTLSGGEARRVRLSASLGSQLVGVCYVLDEPTVGLHPQDIDRLTEALLELRDRGNTVIVVEHDDCLMRRADWIVDMGPGAGAHGGKVVVSGPPAKVLQHAESSTAAYLRGELSLVAMLARERGERPAPGELPDAPSALSAEQARAGAKAEPSGAPGPIRLRGASTHNLKGVDLEIPFGVITGICGPSGSGKSTLVLDTLLPALREEASAGRWKSLELPEGMTRLVVVDASPIGRTPHSVPATYCGLMQPLRELFARTPEAKMRGFTPARFSFNSTQGRCPACEGRGATKVEMQFLADLWLTCEECDGKRFGPEVQGIRHRGRSIADVMEMTVVEAIDFLEHQPACLPALRALEDVGLGYLRLGQSSTTLSGGEAQRVKLSSELLRASSGRSLVVLDEPSTGLAATDTMHLARVLDRLARAGNAVLLIEHHTELLAICEHLIELGPGGGEAGGRVIASGSPAQLCREPNSVTGPWLVGAVSAGRAGKAALAADKSVAAAARKKGRDE